MSLLHQARQVLRTKHYSYRTEQSYLGWIERFIRFHGLRHLRELGAAEVKRFLTDLAVQGHVSASTIQSAQCRSTYSKSKRVIRRDADAGRKIQVAAHRS